MPYAPFHEKFPDIAHQETRTLTVLDIPDLPRGQYGFIEAYCDEPGCDCRRAFFNVADWRTGEIKAVIAYGWESRDFYRRWLGFDYPGAIDDLQGPVLNSASFQSKLAPALLREAKYILQDRNYVDRLKRHYQLYKAAIDQKAGRQMKRPNKASRSRQQEHTNQAQTPKRRRSRR